MPVVSVTRFRVRKLRYVPLFLFHAGRAISQSRKAQGYIAGAVARDADFSFWTMTVWRSEKAMFDYVASGAHRNAMPYLRDWGMEASALRWTQEGAALPEWSDAEQRMRRQGRASNLRYPSPEHLELNYAESSKTFTSRI